MFFHEPLDAGKFSRGEPMIRRQGHGLQPELGFQIIAFHMNVLRLVVLPL